MINFAVTVKDKEERNKVAEAIISVMGQLNPHLRDVVDFKHKLWDHMFIMSEFKLDVDSPYPLPTPETFQTKPEKVPYPGNNIKFKHYGRTAKMLIDEAKKYPEGEEKSVLVELIANMMKRSYINWNRDSVSDEVIKKQLTELSDGELELPEGVTLKHVQPPARNNNNSGRDGKKRSNNSGRHGGRHKRGR